MSESMKASRLSPALLSVMLSCCAEPAPVDLRLSSHRDNTTIPIYAQQVMNIPLLSESNKVPGDKPSIISGLASADLFVESSLAEAGKVEQFLSVFAW